MTEDEERMAESALIEVTSLKEFVTYGVGVSLMQMRDPKLARGRVPVGIEAEALPAQDLPGLRQQKSPG